MADWNLTPAKLPYLKSLAMLPHVEIRVVTIPPARGGFIPYARVVHTKTMTVDDEIAWVRTSNWEGGYLDHSRNIELVLRDSTLVAQVGALHRQVWDSPYAKPLDVNVAYLPPHPGTQ